MYIMLKKPLAFKVHRGLLKGKDTSSKHSLLAHKFPESNPLSQTVCWCSGEKNQAQLLGKVFFGQLTAHE